MVTELQDEYGVGASAAYGVRKPAADGQGAFGNSYKGAQSASEVTLVLASVPVALVQGLAAVALGQDCTELFV